MVIGSDSFGLVGDFEFHITSLVTIDNTGNPYYKFDLGGSASVKARLFGITLAGLGLSFNFHAEGQGAVPITLSIRVEIELLFVTITKTATFQIGVLQFPKPVFLAGDASGNPQAWDGGELVLNTGSRASSRNLGEDIQDESFTIEQIGGTPGDATIKVTGMGRTRRYEHVTSIRADGGSGNDSFTVMPGVTVPVTIDGGDGDDTILYSGTGGATLTGGAGDDYIETDTTSPSNVNGGDGADFIVIKGKGAAIVHGGNGDDQITGGFGADQLFGDAGDDVFFWNKGSNNDIIDGGATGANGDQVVLIGDDA